MNTQSNSQPTVTKTHRYGGNILVVVLVLMVVGMTIISMSLALVISTSQSLGGAMTTDRVRAAAEGGVENAILNVLRNPEYAGETLVIDGLDVTSTVTPGAQTIIAVTADHGAYTQSYEVVLERISGVLSVASWQQID